VNFRPLLFLAGRGHLASQEPILGAGSDSCAEILNRDPELRNFQNGWEHHEINCEKKFFVSGRDEETFRESNH
jgi:hypothetical protein